MGICPICREREANQRNVHMIPWFLIKNVVTEGGSGRRDMEMSFSIDPGGLTKVFFGRSVLPESIDQYKEWSEQEREVENDYARDCLICSRCESCLSRLEAIFNERMGLSRIDRGVVAGVGFRN